MTTSDVRPNACAAVTMPLLTGPDFLEGLPRTPRHVFVDGEYVTDPSPHPALRAAADTQVRLLDLAPATEYPQ